MKGKSNTMRVSQRSYIAIPIIALVLIIITAGSAFAHESSLTRSEGKHPGIEKRVEKHREIKDAISNADFEAFQAIVSSLPEKGDRAVDEETFAKLVEVHALLEAGEKEEAESIMEELGFKPKFDHKKKRHAKKKFGEMDEEKADILRQAHELRAAGDREGAKTLFKTLRKK